MDIKQAIWEDTYGYKLFLRQIQWIDKVTQAREGISKQYEES